MKIIRKTLYILLAAVLVASAAAVSAPRAHAAEYADGTYEVSFGMEGLGRHNVAWDTATVHIEDGVCYVDFTLERVDPRDHAPRYDWLKTDCGTFYPTLDDASYTCTFSRVQVPHLGRVEVSASTSAMSDVHEIDYVLNIADAGIPVKQEPAPTPTPAPAPTPTPTPTPTPEPAPTPDPATVTPEAPDTAADTEAFTAYLARQAEAVDKLAAAGDSQAAGKLIEEGKKALEALTFDESKSLEENKKAAEELVAALTADLTAQREKDAREAENAGDGEDVAAAVTVGPARETKSVGAVVAAAAGVTAVAAAVWLLVRKKK